MRGKPSTIQELLLALGLGHPGSAQGKEWIWESKIWSGSAFELSPRPTGTDTKMLGSKGSSKRSLLLHGGRRLDPGSGAAWKGSSRLWKTVPGKERWCLASGIVDSIAVGLCNSM